METEKLNAQNRVKALRNTISVQRNYKVLIEGYRNARENQRGMGRISLKASRKIKECFLTY